MPPPFLEKGFRGILGASLPASLLEKGGKCALKVPLSWKGGFRGILDLGEFRSMYFEHPHFQTIHETGAAQVTVIFDQGLLRFPAFQPVVPAEAELVPGFSLQAGLKLA